MVASLNSQAATTPRWVSPVLWAAAAWEIAWAILILLAPNWTGGLLDIPMDQSPGLWKTVAAFALLLAFAYAAAALDPRRFRSLVLLGIGANLLVAVLYPPVAWEEGWPVWSTAWFALAALFWALLLAGIFRIVTESKSGAPLRFTSLTDALKAYRASGGRTLFDLSLERPLLVVFLRHAGCTFCREALGNLAEVKDGIRQTGAELILVQMGTVRDGLDLARRFGLDEAQVVSDPGRQLYQAFQLKRGSWMQLLGPKVLIDGLRAALREQYGIGLPQGDVRQMPGAFLVRYGQITQEFRHAAASDRPDYLALASCSIEERR